MPNPWKKARFAAVSRFVSGVRSKRTASPLVVEIGFPTSLADLVVKNRARLKKPSWKKNRSPKSDSAALPESDTAAVTPPATPAASVTPPTIAAASVTPPTIAADAVTPPSIDAAKSPAAEETHCSVPVHLGFLVAKVIVLVALVVIGKKKFVAGITFSAFALLILEILGFRAVDFLKPFSDGRRSLQFLVGGLRFRRGESVSRIEEVEVDSLLDSWESERNCVESVVLDRPSEVLAEEEVVTDQNAGSSGNSKGKKRWKKFIPKKFRKGAIGKNEKEHNSCSSRGRVSDFNREEGVEMSKGQEEEEEQNDVEQNVVNVSHLLTQDDRGNVKETRLWSSRQLVFFLVVLLGLTGGKVVALVLTAVWYLLAKLGDLSWRKCMARRVD